jgi:dTDP-4-dehydrorhamnose 3,5-epimerase
MKVSPTAIPDVLVLEPKVFGDERGWFMEVFNRRTFREAIGLEIDFVQDNVSRSQKNVLRGLHYQIRQPQGKLIRVLAGAIWDVAVDLRRSSATFGKWVSVELDSKSPRMAWIPAGFAHGFLVTSDAAEVQYKTTDYYAPQHERAVLWNDPDLGVRWPLDGEPVIADKDRRATAFAKAETYA